MSVSYALAFIRALFGLVAPTHFVDQFTRLCGELCSTDPSLLYIAQENVRANSQAVTKSTWAMTEFLYDVCICTMVEGKSFKKCFELFLRCTFSDIS